MDVSGIVIAASEVIKLEHSEGFILTVYNTILDLYFCILAHGSSVYFQKGILINHHYKFTNLKAGVLEMISGLKKFLLKTTNKSTYYQIEEQKVTRFIISDNVKAVISVPPICTLDTDIFKFCPKLISYQGFVTKAHSHYGKFELDNKVILYTTFNRYILPSMITGSEVFVSNVHVMRNNKISILVCCGLTSVKIINGISSQDENKAVLSSAPNFYFKYALSIHDLLWIERLSIILKMKFASLVSEEDISFETNSQFLENVLEFFICSMNVSSSKKKLSLVEEYFSHPHMCSAFLEERLPTDCDILFISDILEEAVDSISWLEVNKDWKFSIRNQDNMVLIGILYLSSDGTFFVADKSCSLPIKLTQECTSCLCDQSIIQEFENGNSAFIIALQEYDIIFEKVSCRDGSERLIQYLRTSYCRFFSLAAFFKSNGEPFSPYICKTQEYQKERSHQTCDGVLSKFTINISHESHLTKSLPFDFNTEEVTQRFLVLHKLWEAYNKTTPCSKILVAWIPEEASCIQSRYTNSSMNDSHNYYETDDDLEFASLIGKMSSLCIENNSKLGKISFKSAHQCAHLLPGHVYVIDLKDCDMDKMSNSCDKNAVFSAHAKFTARIDHDTSCEGNHDAEDYSVLEYCSVKEVLLKMHLQKNSILTGILVEKNYIQDSKVGKGSNYTLCMRIQDIFSKDSIHAYVPFFPENVLGLLPGTILELCGFFCSHSQKGNLYLKASPTFGIEVKKIKEFVNSSISNSVTDSSFSQELSISNHSDSALFHTTFRRLCFIDKIVSAEVFLQCYNCTKNLQENCLCSFPGEVKIKVSALVDDGICQYLAYCCGEAAKMMLSLDKKQWSSIVSFVKLCRKPLKYSDKMQSKDIPYLTILNQVFYYYCSSKLILRQVLLECVQIPNPDLNGIYRHFVWCKNVIGIVTKDVMLDLYMKLKKYKLINLKTT